MLATAGEMPTETSEHKRRQSSKRIDVVDALRAFAILAILLLHNLEHFDFYYKPENLPVWIKPIDSAIWDSLFFLFAGKAYGIFAILFGFTFWLQQNRAKYSSQNFGLRFLSRLFILFLFGTINSLFYEGDILSLYAILGVFLIPVRRLNDRTVLGIAIFLLLQPLELGRLIFYYQNSTIEVPKNASNEYFSKMGDYLEGDSFWETIKGNFINGKIGVMLWSWEAGRFFQIPALFMIGMLLGRRQRFTNWPANKGFWITSLIYGVLVFVPLFLLRKNLSTIFPDANFKPILSMIIKTWANAAFITVLIASFVALFQTRAFRAGVSGIIPAGRMTLTNYVCQSVTGSFIYYGYGLGLYKYTGATYCLLIGIILFIVQLWFCRWWLKDHKQGPLEWLWAKLTWTGQRTS